MSQRSLLNVVMTSEYFKLGPNDWTYLE